MAQPVALHPTRRVTTVPTTARRSGIPQAPDGIPPEPLRTRCSGTLPPTAS